MGILGKRNQMMLKKKSGTTCFCQLMDENLELYWLGNEAISKSIIEQVSYMVD